MHYMLNFFWKKYNSPYVCFYFPRTSSSNLVNFFVVLPRRLAFRCIYDYGRCGGLKLSDLRLYLTALSVVLFIGMPILVLRFFWLLYDRGSLSGA